MNEEAKSFLGKKDFSSFQASDSAETVSKRKKSRDRGSVRTIKGFQIRKKAEFIHIDIESDGFLYKMVRNMIGTLLEVGSGLRSAGSIKMILKKKSRLAAGMTAPAKGLCLLKVKY